MDHVEILPYNPSWPKKFIEERDRLKDCLSDLPVLEIRHFGSTAIINMPAKPIIDILIAVGSLDKVREHAPPLLDQIGYDFWHDNPKKDRLFFVKGMPPRGEKRTHHVHICEQSSEMWSQLAFCDFLSRNPMEASEYASLKNHLSEKYREDREAYTNANAEFISQVMQKILS